MKKMKRIVIAAVSLLSVGSALWAGLMLKKKGDKAKKSQAPVPEDKAVSRRHPAASSRSAGMAVKKDGSLAMPQKHRGAETAAHVHLKKNGEPDRRFKENRSR